MHTESNPAEIRNWIRDAQGGDGEAFDALARHFLPRIRRWALVRTGDEDDADDVVQRTLVQMYRKLGRFRGDSAFGSWLFRITANAATEHHRRAGARKRAVERMKASAPTPEAVQPESTEADDLGRRVREFLTDLSPNQRQMMDLVDLQGYTPAEAAEMLELKAPTARVHLLRARRRLRERLLQEAPSLVPEGS